MSDAESGAGDGTDPAGGGDGGEDAGGDGVVAPSDAFERLGNPTRLAVLRALVDREAGGVVPVERTFSELFEAAGGDTTAGFAYHLRQLDGHYVRKGDDRYRLTSAGLAVVRALESGRYTDSVDRGPVALDDDCPFCGRPALVARTADSVTTVGCDSCERDVLSLSLSPGGLRAHGEGFPAAIDRHHRHRLAAMTDGVCPDCGGPVDARVEVPDRGEDGPEARPRAALDCATCGARLRCPVALAVLDHPAVVSLYHAHGLDSRERPLWNAGEEWRERVLSTDPVAVRVTTRVGEDVLALYLGRDLSVVETERTTAEPEEAGGAGEAAA